MQRTRDLSKFSKHHLHESSKDFLSFQRPSGVHSIRHGEENIDLYIEDRGSPVTLVVFHSALTERIRTTPVFHGLTLSKNAGVNLVAVSDPSIECGDVDLAWYLGNRRTGQLRPVLSPLILHCIESLGTERTVLFGASGGGYAAINFGTDFPNSIVLAVNPRLDMQTPPRAELGTYLRVCHDAVSATPQRRIRRDFVTENLSAQFVREGLPFDLLLFQNLGDQLYLRHQALPFIDKLKHDPRLFIRIQYTGDGHQPIPAAPLNAMMRAICDVDIEQASAIFEAGFISASAQ